jgi:TolB-like protein/Flp pilus assembly protein TadD
LEPGNTAEPLLAHVLFLDIVGCSKLPSDEQRRIVGRLQQLVRESPEFQQSRESDKLISLPTGDGMALAFFDKLDAAVLCAIEVTRAIQTESLCKIRMGVHTGPVFVMEDINHKRSVSGAGINRAERVMSAGEDGHILLSDQAAESMRHLSAWRDKIHEVGPCQVKDGWIRVWNLVDGPIGNPVLPKKSKRHMRGRKRMVAAGLTTLGVLLLASLVVAFWLGRIGRGRQAVQDKASIAVMPFKDMSPEKNQEYFSDGLAEELLTRLAKVPGLRVAGRTSSFKFKGANEDYRVIGERLNVAALLEGSVRKQNDRAKITVQLIKVADGFDMWSEEFDRNLDDIFAVQEGIARAVTGALKIALLGDAKAPAEAKRTNADAYNAFLQGRYFLARRNKENLEKAVSYFDQAVQLDAGYAPAWTGLGEARGAQAARAYVPVEEGYQQARQAVEKALVLDANLGQAHAVLGSIQMNHDWNWAGADASYKRALALEPGNARAIMNAGSLASDLGRLDEAIALNRRATTIEPLDSGTYYNLGLALHYAGRQEEARAAIKKALELAPERALVHGLLSQVSVAQSHPQEALAEAEKEVSEDFRLCELAMTYHALGSKKQSDATLAELIAKFQATFVFQIAEVYAFRGENDHAFEWLDRTFAEHDPGLTTVKSDPLLKNLRHDPRYAALLKKMRL